MEKAEYERKSRELEVAKIIRDNAYDCGGSSINCAECPRMREACMLSPDESKAYWDDFIAAREAELAQTAEEPGVIMSSGKTVDDFAIALIKGGYYVVGENVALYNAATGLKAESDRRQAL